MSGADDGSARPPSFAPGASGATPPGARAARPAVPVGVRRPTVPARTARSTVRTAPAPAAATSSAAAPPSTAPPATAPPETASAATAPAAARPARTAASRTATPPPSTPAGPSSPRTSSSGRSAGGPPRVTVTDGGPSTTAPAAPAPAGPRRRRRTWVLAGVAAVLVLLLAWPVALAVRAGDRLRHVTALSGAPGTPGTTYLLAGSDSRADGAIGDDAVEGARADSILLLHVPDSGPAALVSLPRDTYVDVPGRGPAKLNAAYSWGQAPLLVATVEELTGLTVDHYVEIGMGGVEQVVDAVGGVSLCYDADVSDPDSGMQWTAGCHQVGGVEALAFARMRKADPLGDVGRAQRQRQLIAAVMGQVSPAALALHPGQQTALLDAGLGALQVDEDMGVTDVARLALAFRAATGPGGVTGTPPVASFDYRPGNLGSTVLLDPETAPQFFADLRDGTLPPGPVGGTPAA